MGSPVDVQLIPLEEAFIGVHFKLMDTGELVLDQMSDTFHTCLSKALPRLAAARAELYDSNIKVNSGYWKERMRQAVEEERAREYPCNAEKATARALGFQKH